MHFNKSNKTIQQAFFNTNHKLFTRNFCVNNLAGSHNRLDTIVSVWMMSYLSCTIPI